MNKFDMIIGYSATKKELKQISDTLNNREAYDKLGVSLLLRDCVCDDY